jgi:hypothetical protein
MENFKITPFDTSTAVTGYLRATVSVKGYWSTDVISLYIQRTWANDGQWNLTISHSSGGRDPKQVLEDADAEENFGLALVAAAKYGREVMSQDLELEKIYQEGRRLAREAQAAAEAAQKALVEADAPLGAEKALRLLDDLAKNGGHIRMFTRGYEVPVPVSVSLGRQTRFYIKGMSVSKANVLGTLAGASHRSTMIGQL